MKHTHFSFELKGSSLEKLVLFTTYFGKTTKSRSLFFFQKKKAFKEK